MVFKITPIGPLTFQFFFENASATLSAEFHPLRDIRQSSANALLIGK
jgi:hypothetical protein